MNFAFAFEPKEDDLMRRDPKVAGARTMISRKFMTFIVLVGICGGLTLLGFYAYLTQYLQTVIEDARTLIFIALTLVTI